MAMVELGVSYMAMISSLQIWKSVIQIRNRKRKKTDPYKSENRSEAMMSHAEAAWSLPRNQEKSHDCTVSRRSVGILF